MMDFSDTNNCQPLSFHVLHNTTTLKYDEIEELYFQEDIEVGAFTDSRIEKMKRCVRQEYDILLQSHDEEGILFSGLPTIHDLVSAMANHNYDIAYALSLYRYCEEHRIDPEHRAFSLSVDESMASEIESTAQDIIEAFDYNRFCGAGSGWISLEGFIIMAMEGYGAIAVSHVTFDYEIADDLLDGPSYEHLCFTDSKIQGGVIHDSQVLINNFASGGSMQKINSDIINIDCEKTKVKNTPMFIASGY